MSHCEECKASTELYQKLCHDCALKLAQKPGGIPGRPFTDEEQPHIELSLSQLLGLMIKHGGFSVFLIQGDTPKILLLDAGVTGPIAMSFQPLTAGDCIRMLYPLLSKDQRVSLSGGAFIELPVTFEDHLFSFEIVRRNDSPEALIIAEQPIKKARAAHPRAEGKTLTVRKPCNRKAGSAAVKKPSEKPKAVKAKSNKPPSGS